MKQYTAVFHLMLRAAFFPALLICAVMVLAESVMFLALSPSSYGLVWMFDRNLPFLIFSASVTVLTIVLLRTGSKHSADPGLTLRRLSISEQHVFLLQAGCNLLFYWLLALVQALLLLCFALMKLSGNSRQTLFLILHGSFFAHTFFPFRDILLWISNGVMLLTLSMAAAHVPYAQRRGKHLHELFLVIPVFILNLHPRTYAMLQSILTLVVCLLFLSYTLYCVFREEDVYNEAECF